MYSWEVWHCCFDDEAWKAEKEYQKEPTVDALVVKARQQLRSGWLFAVAIIANIYYCTVTYISFMSSVQLDSKCWMCPSYNFSSHQYEKRTYFLPKTLAVNPSTRHTQFLEHVKLGQKNEKWSLGKAIDILNPSFLRYSYLLIEPDLCFKTRSFRRLHTAQCIRKIFWCHDITDQTVIRVICKMTWLHMIHSAGESFMAKNIHPRKITTVCFSALGRWQRNFSL